MTEARKSFQEKNLDVEKYLILGQKNVCNSVIIPKSAYLHIVIIFFVLLASDGLKQGEIYP